MSRAPRPLLLALFLAALLVRGATALSLPHAGYTDAFYYFHVAQNMAEGRGLTESLLWNYLDQPTTLPRPANQYWMPLTNVMAWASMALVGGLIGPWRAAQLPFVLGSALLPPLSAWLAWRGWGRRDWAVQAGLLTIFSGFYFVYWVTTDNFTPFALGVAVALLGMWQGHTTGSPRGWALAGLGAGLSHLARVDGALLVPLIAALLGAQLWRGRALRPFLAAAGAAALGYGALMGPWLLRNWLVTGTPFPGGGLQTLWLREYNEIFYYEPLLTPQRYLEWGLGAILGSKLRSLLLSALIVLGAAQFFLAPLVALALPRAWRHPLFRPFLFYTLLLVTAMPLLFTFPATRGSLLHSTAALLPWAMALVPAGVERGVRWLAARRRTWQVAQASAFFGWGFVMVAMIITLYLYVGAIWQEPAPNATVARWAERTQPYAEVGAWLTAQGVPPETRVISSDPAAFHVTTGYPAITLPLDGAEALSRAAQEWQAPWLLLDRDGAANPVLRRMYDERAALGGWQPVASFTDGLGRPAHLFRLEDGP